MYVQSAVKAAINGRVLVLEGIEKAERNVLPVLNNLLENREMQLDDGRFLMAANRYDKLLEVWETLSVMQSRTLRTSPKPQTSKNNSGLVKVPVHFNIY